MLDTGRGTGAVTRVLVDTTDGERHLDHHRGLGEHHRGQLAGALRLDRLRAAPRLLRRRARARRRIEGSTRGSSHDRVEPDRRSRWSSCPRRSTTAVVGRARPDRQDARRRRAAGRPLVPDAGQPGEPCRPCCIRTPYGRTIMGPLGRLYAERGYQVVIQSCRGTFGSGGEWVPVRNEQADGQATLEWVAAQPWFDGRLVMWGASYLGMTQWAVAEDAPDFLQGAQPPGHRGELPRRGGVPRRCLRPRDGAGLAAPDQAPGAGLADRAAHAAAAAASVVARRRARSCRSAKCDTAAIGEPMRLLPGLARAQRARATPGGTRSTSGAGWSKVPPASFVGGWYDLFLPAQVDDYEALRRAGRTARLTIGPWTHASPGLFAETVRDGPRVVRRANSGTAGHAPSAGAPVRLFVMGSRTWQEFSMWPPAGETAAVVPRARAARWRPTPAAGRARPDRYHYNPHDPTPAVGGPSLNWTTAGRKDQRAASAGRDVADLHQRRRSTRGPHRDRPADRHALRALVARAHRLLRAPVRRVGEGQVVQPERRHRPAHARLGR